MSLMTQSLKRLAERGEPRETATRVRAEPPSAEPPTAPEPPAPPQPPVAVQASVERPAASPTPERRTIEIPRAFKQLREAIDRDLGTSRAGRGSGRVVVFVSLQADGDTAAAASALGEAFFGNESGDVLTVDASGTASLRNDDRNDDDYKYAHGFTSLVDGTRGLDSVLVPGTTGGLFHIRHGLAKGEEQVIDADAVKGAWEACRTRYAWTLVNGGTWRNSFLPAVARGADAVYLVVRAHVTEEKVAREALVHFEQHGVAARGCILAGAGK